MTEIENILTNTSHRPFALPPGRWKYYQEWNNALFLHWKVPFENLRNCVPEKFYLDSFDGACYISIVAFSMQNIRPRYLPALKFISDFHEINLRTYIENDNKKGVYFLNIEAQKYLSAALAKTLSSLPYEKAEIKRSDNKYYSVNKTKNYHLDIEFEIGEKLAHKTELDRWLTERYCLYFGNNEKAFRYDIHHKEWEIKNIEIKKMNLAYRFDKINLSQLQPDFLHYSNGVKVLAWQKQRI